MYNKASIKANRSRIVLYFLIAALPVVFIFNFMFTIILDLQIEVLKEKTVSRQKEIVSTAEFHLESLFNSIYDDLNLILYSNEFSQLINDPGAAAHTDAQQMFARFLKSKSQYFQLRYINQSGMEVIRAERKNGEVIVVDDKDLQNKSERYYFKSLVRLGSYDLYISDFDLNIENGEYVVPYQPAIRLAIPVFNHNKKSGFIMINLDGFEILNIVSKYELNKSQSINLSIIDKNHLLTLNLLDMHQELVESLLKTFTSDDEQFQNLYKQASFNDHGEFQDGSIHFYYNRIQDEGDHTWVFDSLGGRWIVISDFNVDTMLKENGNFITDNVIGIRIVLSITIILIVLVLVILLVLKRDDELLLLVSAYISETTHDGVLITDSRKRIVYCNKVFEGTYGYKLSEIRGKKPDNFLEGQSEIQFKSSDIDSWVWDGNIWDITSGKTYILKHLRIKVIGDGNKKVAYYIGIYSEPKIESINVTDEYVVNHQLIGSSMDFITPVFEKKFDNLDKKAVIVIRLNEFDMFRSQITDKEDTEIVGTITNSFKSMVSMGGIVLVPSSGLLLIVAPILHDNSLYSLMEDIDASLTSIKFSLSPNLRIDYVSGVAVSPDHGIHGPELINNAFIALEALAKTKKSKYLVYDQDIYDLVKKDKIIRDEVENAFINREFTVVYQLQQDAATLKNTGIEALVRWNSASIGPISPNSFIPIMEDSSQIIRLGKYVLSCITMDFKDIYTRLPEGFRISINLSSQEFNNSEIISDMIQIIDESGLPRSLFCFEITETSIVDSIEHTNTVTKKLHDSHILTAIDDFGTGYSSLSYLKNIAADKIKIDRMFVKDYPFIDDGKILSSIIKLVKEMNKKIIVEGVETDEQLDFIRKNKCEEFQGYLSSKPITMNELLKKLDILP